MTTISFEENVGIKKKKFKNLATFFVYLEEQDMYPPSEKHLSQKEFEEALKRDCEEARNTPRSRLFSLADEKDIEKAAIQDISEDFLTPKELSYYLSLK